MTAVTAGDAVRMTRAGTPPVAYPVAWCNHGRTTWSSRTTRRTGARTVLDCSCSLTAFPGRAGSSLGEAVHRRRIVGASDRADIAQRVRIDVYRADLRLDRDRGGVGRLSWGWYPFAPPTFSPFSSPFSSFKARKENKKGDRS